MIKFDTKVFSNFAEKREAYAKLAKSGASAEE